MYGIELPNLIRFFMQGGTALLGATSLWGFIFLYRKNIELAKIVFKISLVALFIFLTSWFFVYFIYFSQSAYAHEGITLPVEVSYLADGLRATQPLVFLILIVGTILAFIGLKKSGKDELFLKYGKALFFSQFILVSLFLTLLIYTGEFGRDQIFYSLHGWHSIFTLGTVITIDILYMLTLKKSDSIRRALYTFFPIMSAVIWVGLGLDFLSAGLIIQDGILITDKFLFNQTVVAIIIINGALLSGKVNKLLISLVKPGGVDMPRKIALIFGISGSISIVSWLTITFIDFHELTLSYSQLFLVYAFAIFIAFFCQHLIESRFIATTDKA